MHSGYSIRSLSADEFRPLWETHHSQIFGDRMRLNLDAVLSDAERAATAALRQSMGTPLTLRYGLFKGEEFVGWHIGDQKSPSEFYMRNSAVLPGHRRRGLYSSLIDHVVNDLTARGFQIISSRHTAVNNAVIIPKLKLGFVITGVELSDMFGMLVNLTYIANAGRRKVLEFRAGEILPDQDMRKWLGMI